MGGHSWDPYCSFRGVYHVASNKPQEERSQEGPNLMMSDMKGQGI